LVGNIGVPALDVLDEIEAEDVVVYELSSFQLWDMRRSPQVAVVGHIEPDHLDVHRDFTEYVGAKANITKWQSEKDVVVYDRGNVEAVKIAEASRGEKIGFPTGEYEGVLDSLRLVGRHNRLNGEAAIIAARCLGVEDVEAWKRGLASFTGLPHRTKFVREVGGVSYYDNSIATVPGSTITDIRAFSEPKVLILGGSTKGAEFYELAKVVSHGGVRGVVLMGPEGEKVGEALRAAGFSEIVNVGREYDMKEVVRAATEMAQAGDVVILSPAAASFDRFKSYAERGDKFIQAVEEL
jgi:UDP-N-acetylmuramoylalanine--D-glutamate ligase